ncbi:bifunctional 4-hydroxy-2-oxoglutarate aldolase/2-dehydro-3-deoxy-phosphogluconate aldolase [Arthrobacter glacialis]|uniref:bifunctional 4-hydroxy-2-oxoglutarate aldolase/2-dehydro-3-deoxy-phosphogluconate aldolase n=1 Tax=Arthrobacter glacialis TaxID=1664 RepID=UPI000CD46BDA|nr:bifunctional 4-hydroxy-2-oxoglutarate aldolase/2-dehydro-3-deoxy-phosphogluconate aldolase [Arthrobacter glacialis]POH60135.1 2-dehydro-3-deoxyphosphogluconate aldolase [Arthrobacter glacialis]
MSYVEPLLLSSPIIAILRASTPEYLVAAADVLVAEGINTLEFPLTTPGVLDAISAARSRLGERAAVGAGTVLTGGHAASAIAAGAQFTVSPAVCSAATHQAVQLGVPAIPGAMTPTEVLACVSDGAFMVKLFPAVTLGPVFIQQIKAPLPSVRFVATGGVGLSQAPAYLAAGASSLGVGSPLLGNALETGDLEALRLRARAWVQALGIVAVPAA